MSEEHSDSERLTWLERHSAEISVFDPPSGDAWVWEVWGTDGDGARYGGGCGRTLREAIDDAMARPDA